MTSKFSYASPTKNQTNAPIAKSQKKFTLVELLVCISVIAVLSSMLSPSLKNAMESAKSIQCKNNLKTLFGFSSLYLEDNDDYFPKAGYEQSSKSDAFNETDVDNFYGYTWDDLLSIYDGRELSKEAMKVNNFIVNPDKTWSASFLNEKHGAMEYYMCPEDDFSRRNFGSGERIGRSYSMNAHSPDSYTYINSRADYNIDTFARKGISVGAHSITTSEVDDTQGTIYIAESINQNNDLGGSNSHVRTPVSLYDMSGSVVDQLSKGRLGPHSSYTSFNFLITDGHIEELLLAETHNPNKEGSANEANRMWSRQAND